MWSPYKLTTMRYRGFRTGFKRNHKSEYLLVKISNTVLHDQNVYQTSLLDKLTPQSVQRHFNWLYPTNPDLSVAGLGHPITSKNQSRSNHGFTGLSYHLTWCDVQRWDPASWARWISAPNLNIRTNRQSKLWQISEENPTIHIFSGPFVRIKQKPQSKWRFQQTFLLYLMGM